MKIYFGKIKTNRSKTPTEEVGHVIKRTQRAGLADELFSLKLISIKQLHLFDLPLKAFLLETWRVIQRNGFREHQV